MKISSLNMMKIGQSLLLATTLAAAGCATTQPPKELVDARDAYSRSEHGKARQYNPAALHEAKTELDRAEASFNDDGDSEKTRDEAYIAMRRAERAEVEANTIVWQQRQEKARVEMNQAQAKGYQKAQSELAATRTQLEQEKAAREAAEMKSKDMLAKLAAANALAVKEEARGTVITLAGGVLFASGKSELLPSAENNLSQVAEAISSQHDKHVLVEGYTDSRGSAQLNQNLSKARADSVAAFLVNHGVETSRITTSGLGPSNPVADNKTAEGRANNRRVELVLQRGEAK